MLTRFEIATHDAVLGGQPFGAVGAYEQLTGSSFFAFDPDHPRNENIVDLKLVPRNATGGVECRADFWILQPQDRARGNGNLLYYVVNRGRKGALSTFNLAEGSNAPHTTAHFGDGLLLEMGYTVAACAWQADVPPVAEDNADLMTLDAPVAVGATGLVGCEILVDETVQVHSLGSRYHWPYEVEGNEGLLTVREEPYGAARPIDRAAWEFSRLDDGRPAIRYDEGFAPGLIYNLVYTGRDPVVMGTGLAVTRDFVSSLKYGADAPAVVERAYGFGSSQSGRFLRHLLYQGFNEDEQQRQVFDGLQVNVAGGARGSFNHRFAQPSRHASAHFDALYPTEQFPFADLSQEDPHLGARSGLLDVAEQRGVTPKIFYINSSTEYWNRGASLCHVDVDGRTDLVIHALVRIYHFASTQHGAAELPARPDPLPGNPVDFRLGHRALLQALDAWVREGREPPPSCCGSVRDGTLVDHAALGFPDLPGMPPPRLHRRPRRLDHGPDWARGIIGREPPDLGREYVTLVPAVDADGNEIAGIRLPEVAAPLGTFVGWRLRSMAMGAPWAVVGLAGAWLPFAATAGDQFEGDCRLPIDQRYSGRAEYVQRSLAAGEQLLQRGFLLERDLDRVAERAGRMYDWVVQREDQS